MQMVERNRSLQDYILLFSCMNILPVLPYVMLLYGDDSGNDKMMCHAEIVL